MGGKLLLLIFYSLLSVPSVYSQCINSDSLWKRLVFIRDSSANPVNQDLQEMLHFQFRIDRCQGNYDSSYGLLLQRIGAAYKESEDYLQAEKYVKKAIQTIAAIPGRLPVSESLLIKSYYLLSLIYRSQNRTSEKLRAADSCIAICIRSHSTDERLLISLLDKVEYLYYIGDYHQTIIYAREGEIFTNKIQPVERLTYLFNFLIWKVNSLINLTRYEEAENILSENLKVFTAGGPNDYQGLILDEMGEVKTKKGLYTEAQDYFQQALRCNNIRRNYLASQRALANMGSMLYDQKLHDEAKALSCFRQAIAYASKYAELTDNKDSINAILWSLEIYNFMAGIFNRKGQFDSAIYYFQKGFSQTGANSLDRNFADKINAELLQNRGIPSLINGLIDEADCYLGQFKKTGNKDFLYQASILYTNADKLQYIIKNEQTALQSQLFWRKYLRRLYEHAIETSDLMNDLDKVFYYFEKSRAVLLNDQLGKLLTLNKEDITRLGQIKAKILELNKTLGTIDPASEGYKNTQSEIFYYTGDLSILEQQIQNHNPEYLKVIGDTVSIHVKEIRENILKDHDALIEIFDGDSIVYALFITAGETRLRKIDKADFEKTYTAYISFISDLSLINGHFDQYVQTAKHLYQIIFTHFTIPKGRIIISPDGRYFPFESLITDASPSNTHYFLEDYAVSYTYSARYLLNNFSTRSSSINSMNFLGVAPLEFTNFKLSSLPGSDASLKKIEQFYSLSNSLISAKATRNHFLENFPKYKIIQLYTHSSDTSASDEPVIYFSDSALYLSDLISHDKPATRLIVLSACETGNGKIYQGEGVFSFNRGFAALGIPATITNLWAVDNETTYALAELFYKYLSENLPTDIALQKAKLEYLSQSTKEKKLPYYWAAAIIVGRTDIVEVSKDLKWMEVAIILGFSMTGLVFLLKKARRKSGSLTDL
jgi:CHAT domain-containing protein